MFSRRNLFADIIIVGTGPGGATVAREMTKQGKKILLLERGYDHRKKFYYGTYLGAIRYSQNASLLFTEEGLNIIAPVMVGGATGENGARFGRLAAKVPVHRVPEAIDRLLTLYRDERQEGESATDFFGRLEVPRVKSLLADLESLTADGAIPEDYVDLAEETQYKMEVQEGECSA